MTAAGARTRCPICVRPRGFSSPEECDGSENMIQAPLCLRLGFERVLHELEVVSHQTERAAFFLRRTAGALHDRHPEIAKDANRMATVLYTSLVPKEKRTQQDRELLINAIGDASGPDVLALENP